MAETCSKHSEHIRSRRAHERVFLGVFVLLIILCENIKISQGSRCKSLNQRFFSVTTTHAVCEPVLPVLGNTSEQCLCCHSSLVKVLEVKLSSWDVHAQMAFGETGSETFSSAVCYIIVLYFVELQIEPDSWYALIM